MNEIAQDRCQIAITGELNIYTASEWRDRLINESTGHEDIELDLSDVGEIDCAGLQLLLALQRQTANEGRQLRFGDCSGAVRSFLEFTHQTHLLGRGEDRAGDEEEQA